MVYIRLRALISVIILFPTINLAHSADVPTYKDGMLTIPSVSTPEQVGQYQDLIFNYTAQGTWQLSGLKAIGAVIGTSGLRLVEEIYKVDVIKTDTFPTQVLLQISGAYNPCSDGTLGQINQRLSNNRFDVAVTYNSSVSAPSTPVFCQPGFRNFVRTLPLSVYGLSAGTYSYNVNGTTGTFTLSADNKYPGDY